MWNGDLHSQMNPVVGHQWTVHFQSGGGYPGIVLGIADTALAALKPQGGPMICGSFGNGQERNSFQETLKSPPLGRAPPVNPRALLQLGVGDRRHNQIISPREPRVPGCAGTWAEEQ